MNENLLSPVEETVSVPLLPGLHALGFTAPPGFSFAHWQGYMCFVRTAENAIDWWLGDMLIWADQQGKEVEEAAIQYAHELGFADQTCANTKSLAKRYPLHSRFGALTPSHHNMVRGLEEPERMKLLEQAQAEHWSVSQLKAAKNGGCAQNGDISPDSAENSNESKDLTTRAFLDGYGAGLRKAMELIEPYKNEFVSIAKAIDLIQAELAKA